MKGILKMDQLKKEMPLVYQWLKNADSTLRLLRDNYSDYEGEELLTISIKENVLTQIKNIETYPVVRSRLYSGDLYLHAWFYEIETGIISAYDANQGEFVPLSSEPFPVPDPLSKQWTIDTEQ
jgi:carbonic anhydrase